MSVPVRAPAVFVPDVTSEVGPKTQLAVRQMFATLQQHEQAFASLKKQVDAKAPAVSTTAASSSAVTPTVTPTVQASQLGHVNSQIGTSYIVQDTDYGGIITFENAQAVAVTLNGACRQFWFAALQNIGPGVATLTPDQYSINYGANIVLSPNQSAWVFYDGMNWWAATTPAPPTTTGAAANLFLTGYNAATGQFTAAQPAFSNITGVATPAQIPPNVSYSFDWAQRDPSALWVIVHNLNTYPSITLVDMTGAPMEADAHYDSPNQVTLTFSSPISGSAHLV